VAACRCRTVVGISRGSLLARAEEGGVLVVVVLVEIFLLIFEVHEIGFEVRYVFVPSFDFFLLAFLLC
jgi:hypothetical protein